MPGQRGSPVARLALRRGAAHGRGDAPADASWPSASTARCCRTRTARRCGSWCRGSTASRASSRSSRSRFVEKQPPTTWNMPSPSEYGFYSNVNPKVDHPRWSQATRAPHRRAACSPSARDADVQRLRRPGRQPLRRHGPAKVLLTWPPSDRPHRAGALVPRLRPGALYVIGLIPAVWTFYLGVDRPARRRSDEGARARRSACGR